MRLPFGRKPEPTPAPAPEPVPELVPEPPVAGLEREIAVGSLSGIAPTDVHAHLLLVVDHDGGLKITGVACDDLAIVMLSQASVIISRRILAAHAHDAGPS